MTGEETVSAALRTFRDTNGLRHDEHLTNIWVVEAGLVSLYLPKFSWRRRAIDAHDVHHLLTGYPCTVMGELQIAAWELGAGRYPHWGATFFCGPIVLIGLFWDPYAIIRAWRHGRRSRSLYGLTELGALPHTRLAWARRYMDRTMPS